MTDIYSEYGWGRIQVGQCTDGEIYFANLSKGDRILY